VDLGVGNPLTLATSLTAEIFFLSEEAVTAKESLLDLLKQQKHGEEQNAANIPAQKKEWLQAVGSLMKTLRGWLKDAEKEKLLEVQEFQEGIQEQRIGSYYVPALKIITPAGVVVRLAPKARFVVGAYGRVDLDCPPKRASLIRKALPADWQWAQLTGKRAGWTFVALNEESFWETLQELLS